MPRQKSNKLVQEAPQQDPTLTKTQQGTKVKSALYMYLKDLRSLDEMAVGFGFATRTDLIKAIARGALTLRVNKYFTEKTALALSQDVKADWNHVLSWAGISDDGEDMPVDWREENTQK